jgi:replicative superfamily II helicase
MHRKPVSLPFEFKFNKKFEKLNELNTFYRLHDTLIEHLNVELVLRTVNNLETAVDWLKSTFFYVRLCKNPAYYHIQQLADKKVQSDGKFSTEDINKFLEDLCLKNLDELMEVNLTESYEGEHGMALKSTFNGALMAKYCLAFETMKSIILKMRPPSVGSESKLTRPNEISSLYLNDSHNYSMNQLMADICRQPNRSLAELVKLIALAKSLIRICDL